MPTGAYAFEGPGGTTIHEVHTTFTGVLFDSLGQAARWSQGGEGLDLQLTQELPTRGNSAKIKMAHRGSGVHEWVDERVKARIERADKEVEVKRWANAIIVPKDDLADDDLNLGQYRPLIAEMADDFVEHKHQLVIDLLTGGFAGGGAYDGQHFFDSDHPIGSTGSNQSNVGTVAFGETGLYTAIAAMTALKKPNGMQANVRPTHGIFPEALRGTVERLLLSDIVVDATNGTKTNVLKGRIIPIFDSRLDAVSTTAWYLLDASKAVKPFWFVNRQAVETDYSDKDEFELGVYYWGANARYNLAWGFYHLMWGSTGAG